MGEKKIGRKINIILLPLNHPKAYSIHVLHLGWPQNISWEIEDFTLYETIYIYHYFAKAAEERPKQPGIDDLTLF